MDLMQHKFCTTKIQLALDVKFYPDFHWLILACWWMLNDGSVIKYEFLQCPIVYLNHGPEPCWPGRYHCPFPCYSQIATPGQVPCHYVCDPIDYITSLTVRPLSWDWLVSHPSMSNQPWGLRVIPDVAPNPWWEAVLAGQNDPVRCATPLSQAGAICYQHLLQGFDKPVSARVPSKGKSPWPHPSSQGLVTQKHPAVCVCSTTPRLGYQAKLPSLRLSQRCCSECAKPNRSGNGPFQ